MPLDYSGQNLRGRSFRGQNLEGANFSGADIRGADFSNANLRDANFSGAKAGLQKQWLVVLMAFLCLLVTLSGFFLGTASCWAIILLEPESTKIFTILPGTVALTLFALYFFVTIRYGLGSRLAVDASLGAIASTSYGLVVVIFAGVGFAVMAEAIAITIAGIVVEKVTAVIVKLVATAVAGVIAWFWYLVIYPTFFKIVPHHNEVIVVTVAVILALLSGYIGLRTLACDEKFTLIFKMAVAFVAMGGTSFQKADLTDADFTKATLKGSDFRNANLTRTDWYLSKELNHARVSESYLKYPQVWQLVTTRQGQNQNFDYFNLSGINLKAAQLQDISFIATNLNKANLQDVDLSRAKLVQTQLDETDLIGATLTGAYIEDWGLTSHTNLHGVRCEYIFMRVPTPDDPNPHRKPDNWDEIFIDGDFADFIKPIVDTLDLYHNQGVDPRAIAISFKQLAENYPDADLRIVGMEVRGEDKFLLRAKTAPDANKSELSAEYFDSYNQIKGLPEREIKLLLAEKEKQIHILENMVMTALERPSFYAQTYSNQGDTMPRKQSNFNLQGAQFGGGLVDAETVNAHQIGGDITNYNQVARTEANNSPVKTILILAANPKNTSPLRLGEEVREIDAGLQRAKKRELFDLKQRWAVRVQEVYQSLLDFKPQIVHFSGHGSGDDGLALEDETGNVRLVDTVALAGLFELFASNVECVVLNACYSEVQANAIVKHIPYVIGMNKEIGDKAAIKFATGFYNALGAGESVEFAYKLGCSVIQLDGIPEHLTPVLKKK